jgi:hypothetical protein
MAWREGHDKRQRRNERQSHQQMGGSGMRRGNMTTSWTRGTGGHGMTRGNGVMRGRYAGRWVAVG